MQPLVAAVSVSHFEVGCLAYFITVIKAENLHRTHVTINRMPPDIVAHPYSLSIQEPGLYSKNLSQKIK